MNIRTTATSAENKRALAELLIYRELRQKPLFQALSRLLENPRDNYYEFFAFLAQNAVRSACILGDCWQDAFLHEVLSAENLFTLSAESNVTAELKRAVRHDLIRLQQLFAQDFQLLAPALPSWRGLVQAKSPATPFEKLMATMAHCSDWPGELNSLRDFHQRYGAGVFCRYWAFKWEGKLTGIEKPDPISLPQIVGLERQKQALLANTKHFLSGLPANCALLHGARGTGKSSLVKAVCSELAPAGLHLLEVAKEELQTLPELLAILGSQKTKFVIFIDDLSFEGQETSYKALKSALEGGVQSRPGNILIYATSNRRHLITESFTEREEINGADTVEEKLSLSDRFGLNITFPSPDQDDYLAIVRSLAASFPISSQELTRRALEWERRASGRSGRLARQFVIALAGELGIKPDWL
jgi:hypothetical protein